MQYLQWASSMEAIWHGSPASAEASLDAADRSWAEVVDRNRILFQDRFNNGDHVRAWLNALREGGAR
jgi:hypothetical protein